jgi:hypothetical protein
LEDGGVWSARSTQNPGGGRANKICYFDASPHAVALINAEHQQDRALRDRDAHSKGAQKSFVISMLFSEI